MSSSRRIDVENFILIEFSYKSDIRKENLLNNNNKNNSLL